MYFYFEGNLWITKLVYQRENINHLTQDLDLTFGQDVAQQVQTLGIRYTDCRHV